MWERRGAETARSGGVWWGTPEVNGASSPPLLYAECASPLETGLFPVHARWCPRGSRKGALREQVPHPLHGWRARMPGRIVPGGAVGRRRMKPLGEAAAPCAPDPRGEPVQPPDSAPYLDPSFQNTAPPSQPAQHDEDTRSPVYFGHFIPFGHFILLFLFNKSLSEAWRHAHCVCRLLLPLVLSLHKSENTVNSQKWYMNKPLCKNLQNIDKNKSVKSCVFKCCWSGDFWSSAWE